MYLPKKTLIYFLLPVLWIGLGSISCKSTKDPEPEPEPDPTPAIVTKDLKIDPTVVHQTIAGFGGANQMWGSTFPNPSDMKKAFGMDETDLGLSIFRVRISSDPSEWPLIINVCKEALKYGAKIQASPWSPPPALKSNNSDIRGHLLPENYAAFVDHINAFIDLMNENEVDIYAISIQNEPDWPATYESCDWTAVEMRDFLKDHGANIREHVKVAAPESLNFNPNFTNFLLNDADASQHVDIAAGHLYGGGHGFFPVAEQKGKEIWMTEYLLNQDATTTWNQLSQSVIWDESLEMLTSVHRSMEYNWNAYIWWYLKRYYSFLGDGSQGTTSGEILKRGYAFSHFAKFVRPGYQRVQATMGNTNLQVTAYTGDGKTVIVIINPFTSSVSNVSVSIGDEVPESAAVYTTSLSKNREKTEVATEEGLLLLQIPPKSVTTVVVD